MAAGKYSAGRIFLQVVPSFKGVQREISREVKKYNDQMAEGQEAAAEKSAKKAGKRATETVRKTSAMGEAERERFRKREEANESAHQKRLAEIGLKAAAEEAGREQAHRLSEAAKDADAARDRAKERQKSNAALELQRKRHHDKLEALDKQHNQRTETETERHGNKMELEGYRRRTRELLEERKFNNALAREEIIHERKMARRAEAEAKRNAEKIARTRGGAYRAALEKALKGVDDAIGSGGRAGDKYVEDFARIKRAAADLQSQMDKGLLNVHQERRAMREIEGGLQRIAARGSGAGEGERGNARAALREIRELQNAQKGLARSSGRVGSFFGLMTRDADDGANAFRIFNYRILGAVTLLPLLGPLLGVAAGGLVAFGTAALGAAAGLGVAILAFSGIGEAVKALGDVQDNAAKDSLAASKTMRNAARGVRDAQQGLARAQQQAARSAEDSNRRIADAERRLADAQQDALEVQERLREARQQAQRDQEDLADKIRAGKLDERQALIDLFNAQVNYNAIMASGGSTNLEKEQASIDLGRAQLAIKEIRDSNRDLAAESQKVAREGVEGSEVVQDAKKAEADAARNVADAERGVADARRDAAESAADNALAIRDAQERVTDAQMAYQEALTQTGDIGSASMSKLEQAMDKLSPAGQRFARYLFGLRSYFRGLRDDAQEGMLPGVQNAMETLLGRYGPGFQRWIGSMSVALGGFFEQAAEGLTNPAWEAFFGMMEKNAAIFTGQFGEVFFNFLTGIVSLMTAFAPAAVDMGDGMVAISAGFAAWAAGLKDTEGFQKFMDWLYVTGPKVWEFIKGFGGALIAVGVAMAPIADKLLDFFIGLFDTIMEMDPDLLAAIVTGILGFILASQLAAGAMQLILTLRTPFHSMFGMLIFLFTALAVGLIYAYQHSETFRENVDKMLGFIRDNWKWISILLGVIVGLGGALFTVWKVMAFLMGPFAAFVKVMGWASKAAALFTGPVGLIVLAVIAIIGALVWAYFHFEEFRRVVDTVAGAVGKAIGWLWTNIVKPYIGFMIEMWKNIGAVVWWFLSGVLWPVFELAAAVFIGLWTTVWEVLQWIAGGFKWVGEKIGEFWMKYINPWLDKFGLGADDLANAWDLAIDAIVAAWDWLKQGIWKPIKWIVDVVINKGFVENFNKLADLFGTSHIPQLTMPGLEGPNQKSRGNLTSKGGGRDTAGGSFHTGGYTGPGGKYEPRGVVHADEYVIRKESTNALRAKYGIEVLDYLNRYGDLPLAGGYASGGLVAFGRGLQKRGYQVGQHPAFGRVGRHSKGSLHYVGRAIDVNADGRGQAYENQMLDALIPLVRAQGFGMKWRSPGHYGHAHIDVGGSWKVGGENRPPRKDGGIIDGIRGFLGELIAAPLDVMGKAMNSLMSGFDTKGPFGDFIREVPSYLLETSSNFIKRLVSGDDAPDEAQPRDGGDDDPRGYWAGGLVDVGGRSVPDNGTMMYDNGGYLPPGLTQVLNLTGKPEPVFTADQFAGMGGGGRGPLIGKVEQHLNGTDVTASDVAGEIMWAVTKAEHGGRYSGVND